MHITYIVDYFQEYEVGSSLFLPGFQDGMVGNCLDS